MNVDIYIYNQAEVLDFSGPFEVFSTASRIDITDDLFAVFLIGETGSLLTARGGYRIQPNYSFNDHPPLDVLIIAGGVHNGEMSKRPVLDWIAEQARDGTMYG